MDELTQFAQQFMELRIGSLAPLESRDYGGGVTSLVLYRRGQFQVELFLVAPRSGFPGAHRHPDVDSYEVAFGGEINLLVDGKIKSQTLIPFWSRFSRFAATRVTEKDFHGALPIPDGGAFLSIQHWLNNVPPTSVGLNWEGSPTSAEHEDLLKSIDVFS